MNAVPPSILFGPLFAAVQRAGLFADSKTFADAVPRREPAEIMAAWADAAPHDEAALRAFVAANFELPAHRDDASAHGEGLADYIDNLWARLTVEPIRAIAGGSALAVNHRHVVPGGRFRELYYWDSYFTMLGLARSGRQDLVETMILTFGDLLERIGHIPNGMRTYYLSRSHPPVFYLMAGLSSDRSEAARRQRLAWMRIEHRFWMDGQDKLPAGGEFRRVVRLPDGAILNRYWDDRDAPRDESWREDVALASQVPNRPASDLWRDLRAGAESGWDFSSRWLADWQALGTIRTTRFVPIDLNSLLHGLEREIASEAAALGEADVAGAYADRAAARAEAIERWLWNDALGFYADYDLDAGTATDRLTGAAPFALFCGIASPDRAHRTAAALTALLRPGGLSATLVPTGEQWDAPNGWAPLQWIAVEGLRAYGEYGLADQITARWLEMVEANFRASGLLLEKYDVETCRRGGGGEYPAVTGFGWTNAVTLAFLRETGGGADDMARSRADAFQG